MNNGIIPNRFGEYENNFFNTFETVNFGTSTDASEITIFGDSLGVSVDTSAVSTKGKSGWTSGSSYQVEIHCYKFKCLKVGKDGRITTSDL